MLRLILFLFFYSLTFTLSSSTNSTLPQDAISLLFFKQSNLPCPISTNSTLPQDAISLLFFKQSNLPCPISTSCKPIPLHQSAASFSLQMPAHYRHFPPNNTLPSPHRSTLLLCFPFNPAQLTLRFIILINILPPPSSSAKLLPLTPHVTIILPFPFSSNPCQQLLSSCNLCLLIKPKSILGNKFHLQELYMCFTSHKLRGYRDQKNQKLSSLVAAQTNAVQSGSQNRLPNADPEELGKSVLGKRSIHELVNQILYFSQILENHDITKGRGQNKGKRKK